ncbi:MAG: transglutaminase domain-containing protein, partial [Akkermansiaceae bacterium]|nr:transglutaminase domain-containing protein [Armatimonadota bacterium]
LNDVLLAEGFATRHVTCMPKNPDDPDCHVINLVYCTSLSKWVWMDASFAGYWTDEAGTLLSIAEVRERVIAGKPVKAAPTLHHNADPYTEAVYLEYMTKNMYWFTTPVESRFDYETDGKSRQIALVLPGGKHGWEGRFYYTSDPAAFWCKP